MRSKLNIRELRKPATGNSRHVAILAVVLSAIGIGLRLYFYGINRSLSLDEAMLAASVVHRSFVNLLGWLEYGQAAPPGFLFLQKAVVSILGNRDYVHRLVPLVAGIAAIPLMYSVTKRYCTGVAPLVAAGVISLSPQLIYQSSTAKQYSSDVLVTLLLLFVVSKYVVTAEEPRSLIEICIAGIVAMWLSQPSLFILAGIGMALAVSSLREFDSRNLLRISFVGFLWLINFVVLYFVSLRFVAAQQYLFEYWRNGFMPLPPWRDLHWYYNALGNLLNTGGLPIGFPLSIVSGTILSIGVFSILFRNWRAALILIGPFLFLLFASALKLYPFSGRLLFFAISPLLLLIAEGTERIRQLLGKVNRTATFIVSVFLCGFLFFQPAIGAYNNWQAPDLGEDIKPLMAYLSRNKRSNDRIYVYYLAIPAFEYYAEFYGIHRPDYSAGVYPDSSFQDIGALKGNDRVWVVFSHICASCEFNEENYLVHLNALGNQTTRLKSSGTSVYLYDLSGVAESR